MRSRLSLDVRVACARTYGRFKFFRELLLLRGRIISSYSDSGESKAGVGDETYMYRRNGERIEPRLSDQSEEREVLKLSCFSNRFVNGNVVSRLNVIVLIVILYNTCCAVHECLSFVDSVIRTLENRADFRKIIQACESMSGTFQYKSDLKLARNE